MHQELVERGGRRAGRAQARRWAIADLSDLRDSTQFVWIFDKGTKSSGFVRSLKKLLEPTNLLNGPDGLSGFIASVKKPRDLKISGADERATVDWFVNGRLRERNILRHIPVQRIVESYIFGQIHFNTLDRGTGDAITSNREGVISDNEEFRSLLDYLGRDALPKIIDEWDELRLKHKDAGDEEKGWAFEEEPQSNGSGNRSS